MLLFVPSTQPSVFKARQKGYLWNCNSKIISRENQVNSYYKRANSKFNYNYNVVTFLLTLAISFLICVHIVWIAFHAESQCTPATIGLDSVAKWKAIFNQFNQFSINLVTSGKITGSEKVVFK